MDSCRHSVDVNCAPGSDVTWMGGGAEKGDPVAIHCWSKSATFATVVASNEVFT